MTTSDIGRLIKSLAFAMDLTATRVTLDNFVKDLDEYRDTLSEADIEQLRDLHSIAAARQHLDQSERIAQRMATGVATLLVAAASFIILLAVARAQTRRETSATLTENIGSKYCNNDYHNDDSDRGITADFI
jgi:cell division protein FtsX